MGERTITTRGAGAEPPLDSELHKLFVGELLSPSTPLWIVSGWLSDVDLVDNRGGELAEVAPDLPMRTVRFVELIDRQVSTGGDINVVVRAHPHNRAVMRRLEEIRSRSNAGSLRLAEQPEVHEKVLLTDRLKVTGSMNLTHNGRLANSEVITITDDPDSIQRMRHDLTDRYEGALA